MAKGAKGVGRESQKQKAQRGSHEFHPEKRSLSDQGENAGRAMAALLCGRAAWSELWQLSHTQGRLLHEAETTLRVHRDLLEVLTQIQV